MRVKEYRFKKRSRLDNKKAAVVVARLTKIAGKREELTPKAVVDDARSPESPLHEFFEWNVRRAAEAYRLEQARHLIRNLVVLYEDCTPAVKPAEYRAFFHIKYENVEAPYVSHVRIMNDAQLRAELVRTALHEALQWRRRYNHLTELSEVFAAIDKLELVVKDEASGKTKRARAAAKLPLAGVLVSSSQRRSRETLASGGPGLGPTRSAALSQGLACESRTSRTGTSKV